MKRLLRGDQMIFLMNDRVDLSIMCGADGVHLGQDDLPVAMARQLLGTRATVGVSTHSLKQALKADRLPLDYIAVGPVFPTETKATGVSPVGIEELEHLCSKVSQPVVAIGGITLNNIDDVLKAGAKGVAVISAVWREKDPEEALQAFQDKIRNFLA